MSGEPIPATARLSNGGGDPTEPDYAPDVRGLAVAFHLPDGARTDILAQTLPRYPFPDERGFFDTLAISKPSPSALLKLPGFAAPPPAGARRAAGGEPDPRPPRQLRRAPLLPLPRLQVDRRRRRRALRPLHLAADRRRARHPKAEAKRRGADYLFDELARATRARAGADAARGPDRRPGRRRRRPVLGLAGRARAGRSSARSRSAAIDREADDSIVMDPMRLVDGIEPSRRPGAALPPGGLRPLAPGAPDPTLTRTGAASAGTVRG